MPILVLPLALFALSGVGSQTPRVMRVHDQSHYFGMFAGRAMLILGSKDMRTSVGGFYAYGRPDRRLSFHGLPAQLVYEGYLMPSWSDGNSNGKHNFTWALGGLVRMHYRYPVYARHGMTFDLGMGVQYVNHTSVDLNLAVNTTPVAGVGYFFPAGGREMEVGLRLLHVSNGGRKKPNDGQNNLLLMVSWRV